MHCPRCGQEQVAGNLKFCSKCGFPMGLVSELVDNNGTLPGHAGSGSKGTIFTRGNGLKLALVWFIFFELMLLPLVAVLDGEGDIEPVVAVLGFAGALLIAVLSALFLNPARKRIEAEFAVQTKHEFQPRDQQSALPPQQSATAQDFIGGAGAWKAPDTGDLASPSSVTEGTTKLLQKDEGQES